MNSSFNSFNVVPLSVIIKRLMLAPVMIIVPLKSSCDWYWRAKAQSAKVKRTENNSRRRRVLQTSPLPSMDTPQIQQSTNRIGNKIELLLANLHMFKTATVESAERAICWERGQENCCLLLLSKIYSRQRGCNLRPQQLQDNVCPPHVHTVWLNKTDVGP